MILRATCRAKGEGVTAPRSTTAPSALEMIFCVTRQISPGSKANRSAFNRAWSRAGMGSAGRISGKPGTPMIRISEMPSFLSAGDFIRSWAPSIRG